MSASARTPHRHGNMPHLFQGRSARFYDFVSRRLLRVMYRRFAADLVADAPPGGAVLDVGTGPGVLLLEVGRRRSDLRLTGMDLSGDMITAARRNLARYGERAQAKVGDVTDLPFADRSFDLVVSSFSLHHWDHPEAAVGQLARVLRPGGRLVIYDFTFAPFDTLATTADAAGLFAGPRPPTRRVRTGVPFFPRCLKFQMTATAG